MKRSPQVQIDELLQRVADLEDQVRYLKETGYPEGIRHDAVQVYGPVGSFDTSKLDAAVERLTDTPKRRGRPPKAA